MIDSIVQSYKCPECTVGVNEGNIDIIWAAGTTINIDITCEGCGKHSMVKTEVVSLDLSGKNLSPELVNKLKQTLSWNSIQLTKNTAECIKDEEIVDLNKDLRKNKLDVTELLGWSK